MIRNNIENESIECKSSFEVPTFSKSDYTQIDKLEELIQKSEDINEIQRARTELSILKQSKTASKATRKSINLQCIKTIAAFANTKGGELFIGISEDKDGNLFICGIQNDLEYFISEDKLILSFDTAFENYIGNEFQHLITTQIIKMNSNFKVLHVLTLKSSKPVFVKIDNESKFYIRRKASTVELTIEEFSRHQEMVLNRNK